MLKEESILVDFGVGQHQPSQTTMVRLTRCSWRFQAAQMEAAKWYYYQPRQTDTSMWIPENGINDIDPVTKSVSAHK